MAASASPNASRRVLPPAPQIFFGREVEKAAILATLTQGSTPSARIAVLGAPGVGKTSLALSVMHDPQVAVAYRECRIFVRCDSAADSDALLSLIGASISVFEPVLPKLRHAVTKHFSASPTLLVLDNFESTWESLAFRTATEELLACLAAIDSLAIMVTMRGTERPLSVQWSRPFLPPIDPLSHQSALQTFLSISDAPEDDPDLPPLMDIVDRLPLAITLMANLAQQELESCTSLVKQWNCLHTAMLQRGSTRLSSVDVSIGLSLSSSRIQSSQHARDLLGVLSLLPDGVDIEDVVSMMPSFCAADVQRASSTLLQTALAYKTSNEHLRVLAPIRAFMLDYHPPQFALFEDVVARVMVHVQYMFTAVSTHESKSIKHALDDKAGNYESILLHALECGINLEETITSLTNLVHLLCKTRRVSMKSLPQALSTAQRHGLKSHQALCLRRIAAISGRQDSTYDPIPETRSALALAVEVGDVAEEVHCLLELANPVGLIPASWDTTVCRRHASRAMALARQAGLHDEEVAATRIMGLILYDCGAVDDAWHHSKKAMDLLQSRPDPCYHSMTYCTHQLAKIALSRGDLRASGNMASRGITAASHIHIDSPTPILMGIAGYIAVLRSSPVEACGHFEYIIEHLRSQALPSTGFQELFLAQAYLALDRTSDAIAVLEARRLPDPERRQADNPMDKTHVEACLAWGMGEVETHVGSYEAARVYYFQALEIFTPSQPHNFAELLFHVGDTWRMEGGQESGDIARHYFIRSAILNRKLGECLCLLYTLGNMADTYLADGDLATASELTMAVLPRITWSDMQCRAADCHFRLARIALARHAKEEAALQLARAEDYYEKGCNMRGVACCSELRGAHGL